MGKSAKYAKYAYLGAYLGERNMVKWGVPEMAGIPKISGSGRVSSILWDLSMSIKSTYQPLLLQLLQRPSQQYCSRGLNLFQKK